jgi:hypothetical protein
MSGGYELWVSAERTVLVRRWASGRVEVCTRPESGAIWGPPIVCEPEVVV